MKKHTEPLKLSRRQALTLGAGAAGAAWLEGSALLPRTVYAGGLTNPSTAPADGLLKSRGVKGRTINVHTHILGNSTGDAIPAPSVAPFAPPAELTEAGRSKARAFLTRFEHDMLTFDTPEQEEEVLRRHAQNETRGRAGTLEQNTAHLVGEMDDAGIDTAVVLYLDFAGPMFRKGPIDPSTDRAERGLVVGVIRVRAFFLVRRLGALVVAVRAVLVSVTVVVRAARGDRQGQDGGGDQLCESHRSSPSSGMLRGLSSF